MNYTSTTTSYRDTKQFSELINRYQESDEALLPHITGFATIDNFQKQIKLKSTNGVNRDVLVTELLLQYQDVDDTSTILTQIDKIKNNNTFTVTTGHQCCLFSGPLYFIFKIISTINLAKKLNQEIADNYFVPVFWMATEDHDFAEINSIQLLNNTITYQNDEVGNAVGRIKLINIEKTIAEIEPLIQHFEFGKTALELLKKAYGSNETIASATRKFVHALFKNDGLVIVDADSKSLKNQFREIVENDIIGNGNYELVNATTQQLINAGLLQKSQITPRAVNLFLCDNNKRLRIDKSEFGYELKDSDKKFSQSELVDLLKSDSEKFSPNVVLRPLYQETILPNLAYIGGGAEVTYWLQLREVFKQNKIPFPLVILRNSALILEKNHLDKFLNLGFLTQHIFENKEELQKNYLKKNTNEQSFEEEVETLNQLYNTIKAKAILIDKTLANTVDGELSKSIASIKNVEQKVLRAQKRNMEIELTQIEKFKNKYFPNDGLQERNDNFLYFFAKYGYGFIEELKNSLHPLNNQFITSIIE